MSDKLAELRRRSDKVLNTIQKLTTEKTRWETSLEHHLKELEETKQAIQELGVNPTLDDIQDQITTLETGVEMALAEAEGILEDVMLD